MAPLLFESPLDLIAKTRNVFSNVLKRFRRKKMHGRRGAIKRVSVRSGRTGRATRYMAMRNSSDAPAVIPTIRTAIMNAHYNVSTQSLTVTDSDIVRWIRSERASLTMILLVDLSRSTAAFRHILAEILKSLRVNFNRNNDRIGLISMQGNQARIHNHPSTNHRVVCRNLAGLSIQGDTPLGDGLMKALDMARQETLRKPGARSIVILLSDCFPEPLTGGYADLFDEPAYRDAIGAAALFRKRGVFLLVINPAFPESIETALNPGQRLSLRIVRESRGQLIRLMTSRANMAGESQLVSVQSDVQRILRSVEDAFDRKLYQNQSTSAMQR